MLKFALAMSAYALAMLGIGYLTFSVAPPGTNAWTALIVPGVGAAAVIACVVLAIRIESNRRLGMIGIHVGLLLPLLMAAGSFSRLPGSLQKNRDYYANSTLQVGESAAVSVSSSKSHPTGYQAVGIGSIGILSSFAFIGVLLLRPKPPAPQPVAAAPVVSIDPPASAMPAATIAVSDSPPA